jgi:hypothetical protein
MARATSTDRDESLKRLGGGRWQTRDERFTIEQQSGRWVIVDAEQTDDLGLPLVRGPFSSLTDAKAGIESARSAGPAASPLADRLAEARRSSPETAPKARSKGADVERQGKGASKRGAKAGRAEPADEAPPEPRWVSELSTADRRRAKRAIERLEEAGIRDAEGIARRDLVGDVAAIAAAAVTERLADVVTAADEDKTSADALVTKLVSALADGQDPGFDVRWRLVDGDGRPIQMFDAALSAALERRRRKR